jgi:hypothetical protein
MPLFLLLAAAFFVFTAFPVYLIGRRLGQRNPWAAFIPFLGPWIVLCESVGRNGWFSLLVFVPTAGPLALLLWTGFAAPGRHGRTRWWTPALIVPGLNVLAYWAYALTLRRDDVAFA